MALHTGVAGLQFLLRGSSVTGRRAIAQLDQARLALVSLASAAYQDRPPAEQTHCEERALAAVRDIPASEVQELRRQVAFMARALDWVDEAQGRRVAVDATVAAGR